MIDDSIKNLKNYVNADLFYREYLDGRNINDFNDFEIFCIKHCKDIMTLVEYYETTKELYENKTKFYNNKINELNKIIDNQNKIINDLQKGGK